MIICLISYLVLDLNFSLLECSGANTSVFLRTDLPSMLACCLLLSVWFQLICGAVSILGMVLSNLRQKERKKKHYPGSSVLNLEGPSEYSPYSLPPNEDVQNSEQEGNPVRAAFQE